MHRVTRGHFQPTNRERVYEILINKSFDSFALKYALLDVRFVKEIIFAGFFLSNLKLLHLGFFSRYQFFTKDIVMFNVKRSTRYVLYDPAIYVYCPYYDWIVKIEYMLCPGVTPFGVLFGNGSFYEQNLI